MPYNVQNEQNIIGLILDKEDKLFEIIDILKPEHFYVDLHTEVFEKILELNKQGKNVNAISISKFFKERLAATGDTANEYITKLYLEYLPCRAVEVAQDILHDYKMREIIHISSRAKEEAYVSDGSFDLVAEVQSELDKIDIAQEGETILDIANDLDETIKDAIDLASNPNRISGVTTGLRTLDRMIGGFPKGELTLLAGRVSMGKTSLGIFNFMQATQAGQNGVFFTMEMKRKELAQRMIAKEAYKFGGEQRDKIYYSTIKNKGLSGFYLTKAQEANERLKAKRYMVDARSHLTPLKVASSIKKYKRKLKAQGKELDFIMLDHALLMKGDDRFYSNRTEEVGDIANQIKAIAKNEDIALVLLTQLNRGNEHREDKRPEISDLKQSGTLEENAGVILFCYFEEYYARQKPPEEGSDEYTEWKRNLDACKGQYEIIVAKNRMGDVGTCHINHDIGCNMFWDKE